MALQTALTAVMVLCVWRLSLHRWRDALRTERQRSDRNASHVRIMQQALLQAAHTLEYHRLHADPGSWEWEQANNAAEQARAAVAKSMEP